MISDKAYIAPGAKIGKNVTIYPFAYIEDDVVIGDDCIIFPYVSIMKGTVMGRGNKVYQNTVLGAEPQDFNYKGDETRLVIGDENIFRENVVVTVLHSRTARHASATATSSWRAFIYRTTQRLTATLRSVTVRRWLATARFTALQSSHLVSSPTQTFASAALQW